MPIRWAVRMQTVMVLTIISAMVASMPPPRSEPRLSTTPFIKITISLSERSIAGLRQRFRCHRQVQKRQRRSSDGQLFREIRFRKRIGLNDSPARAPEHLCGRIHTNASGAITIMVGGLLNGNARQQIYFLCEKLNLPVDSAIPFLTC